MALDALAVRALVQELSDKLTGGRMDKIHQPEKDELSLIIRTYTDTYRLIASANASHPRIHLSKTSKKNPITAPLFCMLMRKHLSGGKITSIIQCGFERIIRIDIESYDELGDLTEKHLYIEIMGRHSNITLTTAENKIIDCIKHVDFSVSSVRQLLPGMVYTLPPEQEKTPLLSDNIQTISIDFSHEGQKAFQSVMDAVSGISPLTAREIVYRTFGNAGILCGELNHSQQQKLTKSVISFAMEHKNNIFKPCIINDDNMKKTVDFSSIDIKQYEGMYNIKYVPSINEALDIFYTARDSEERMRQKSSDLIKLLNTNIERVSKKIAIQKKTLNDAHGREKWKIYGDLLTANLYKIEQGADSVTVENYYSPDGENIKIPLSPEYTPVQNSQRYYKKYSKAKTAQVEAAKQLEIAVMERDYLESTLTAAETAQTESDLNAIRAELANEGYIKRRSVKKAKQKEALSKPAHYISSDGFDIYAGKNNTQNDYLTLKFANSSDLWFHTKNIHGSHTVIKLGVNKEVPDATILEAASIAAYFSKARSSSQVPVDYTQIKNVKKPNGAKPGMVIYDHYNTVYVTPKLPEEK
jgi:predicted ribosome quality control (RQC) complex YloA/Tae2 family protein